MISRPARLSFARALRSWMVPLLSLPLWAGAAVPTNDVCAGAEVIPPTAGVTRPYLTGVSDILQATNDGDPINTCQPAVDRGVWYRFTPANTAFFTLSTWSQVAINTTVLDTVMALYTSIGGCSGPFVEVPNSQDTFGCNDDISYDNNIYHSAITTLLLADATYYILVWRYDDGEPVTASQSKVQMQVAKTSAPQNDTCSNAREIYLNIPVAGSTIGATNDYELADTSCFTGVGHVTPAPANLRDVVYAFTAPAAGFYSFKVLNQNVVNDFVIYLVTNCLPSASPMLVTNCLAAANRNIGGAEEIYCQNLAAQQRVYLIVDENLYETSPYYQGGNFRVEVTACAREAEENGSPDNATPFVCGLEASADPRGDVDFYALGTFPTGSRLFAFVDAGAANNTRDFDLRVTTATEMLEFDASDNGGEFGDSSPNICGLPVPREPLFLRVNCLYPLPEEPYRIYAVVQPSWAKATPEAEPNNTIQLGNASPLNYYRGTLAGLAPSTDVDTFKFAAESGELIFVGLDGNPHRNNVTLDAKLDLLDAEGNMLLSVNNFSSQVASSTNRTPGSLAATEPFSPGEAIVYRVIDDGIYHVQVSISPSAATNVASGDYLLSITKGCVGTLQPNHPVAIASLVAPARANEGEPVTVSGTLLDADALDTHWLIIDWGDVIETNELGPGILTFQVTRQYPDDDPSGSPLDTYFSTVVAIDEAGAAAITNFTLTVANVRPVIKSLDLSTNAPFEGQSVALTGSFTDPGIGDTHRLRIAWGDGTTNTLDLEIGVRTFNVLHTYQDDAPTLTPSDPYTLRVSLDDDDGGSDDELTTVTVRNAAPQLSGVSLTSPLWPLASATLSGTLGDPSPLDTFKLIVNWGDGSVLHTNTFPAGGGLFSLTHPYALSHTNLQVQLTLVDDDTGTTTGTANLQIKPNPIRPRILSITRLLNNNFLLTILGSPGATYRVAISSNLTAWTVLPGSQQTADSNGFILYQDTTPPTGTNRFYRSIWP